MRHRRAPQILVVSRREAGARLDDVLRRRLRLALEAVRGLLGAGLVAVAGAVCTNSGRKLAPGERIVVRPKLASRKAKAAFGVTIAHADRDVVVVDKPAGLTTVRHRRELAELGPRARRFLPPTLADLLPGLLAEAGAPGGGRVRAVHRLDRDTSGLLVLARTPAAESDLGRQFRAHSVERRYLAVVRGAPGAGRIESLLVRDRGDGRRGSSPAGGQHAVTHVRVLEKLGDFSLVECRLETGRTHQVRIHLGEAGTPLCGDRVYDRPVGGPPLPDRSSFTRPALHAAFLAFRHPRTGRRLAFSSPLPPDMRELVSRLRRSAGRP